MLDVLEICTESVNGTIKEPAGPIEKPVESGFRSHSFQRGLENQYVTTYLRPFTGTNLIVISTEQVIYGDARGRN